MAYDENLAERVRRALAKRRSVAERKMFGGLAFMLRGNMCCGVESNRLMVRVGAAEYEKALKKPHASPMDFTGRPLKGYVYVAAEGLSTAAALRSWVERAAKFTATLPPK